MTLIKTAQTVNREPTNKMAQSELLEASAAVQLILKEIQNITV